MSRYDNDRIYADYGFTDETSQFDPLGQWQGGSECYLRDYRVRVPRRMLDRGDRDEITTWIENNNDKPIWR